VATDHALFIAAAVWKKVRAWAGGLGRLRQMESSSSSFRRRAVNFSTAGAPVWQPIRTATESRERIGWRNRSGVFMESEQIAVAGGNEQRIRRFLPGGKTSSQGLNPA